MFKAELVQGKGFELRDCGKIGYSHPSYLLEFAMLSSEIAELAVFINMCVSINSTVTHCYTDFWYSVNWSVLLCVCDE